VSLSVRTILELNIRRCGLNIGRYHDLLQIEIDAEKRRAMAESKVMQGPVNANADR